MPFYAFICEGCGPFERGGRWPSRPRHCPACGAAARRVFTPPGLRRLAAPMRRALDARGEERARARGGEPAGGAAAASPPRARPLDTAAGPRAVHAGGQDAAAARARECRGCSGSARATHHSSADPVPPGLRRAVSGYPSTPGGSSVLIFAVFVLLAAAPAGAQAPRTSPHVNGAVAALLADGDTLYVGGAFSAAGTAGGPLVLAAADGRVVRTHPGFSGLEVRAAGAGRRGRLVRGRDLRPRRRLGSPRPRAPARGRDGRSRLPPSARARDRARPRRVHAVGGWGAPDRGRRRDRRATPGREGRARVRPGRRGGAACPPCPKPSTSSKPADPSNRWR